MTSAIESRKAFFYKLEILIWSCWFFFLLRPFPVDYSGGIGDSSLRSIGSYGLILSTGLLLTYNLSYLRQSAETLFQARTLVLFLCWMLCSLTWTIDPSIAFFEWLKSLAVLCLCLILVKRFRPDQILLSIQIALVACMTLSFIACVLFPRYGLTSTVSDLEITHGGLWKGVFSHKNIMGAVAGQAAFFFFFSMINSLLEFFIFLPIFLVTLTILVKTHSSTATIMAATAVVTVSVFRIFRKHPHFMKQLVFFWLPIILLVGGAIVSNFTEVMTFLGQDPTLTGRTPVWELSIAKFWQGNVWLGSGLTGFWRNPEVTPIPVNYPGDQIWWVLGWKPAHSHNGLLEITLELGFIGLAIFLVLFSWVLFQAVRTMPKMKQISWKQCWFIPWLFSLIVENLTENALLNSGLTWALLSYILLYFVQFNQTSTFQENSQSTAIIIN